MNQISNFPVDAVITWVDGGDLEHQKKMSKFIEIKDVNRNRYDQVEEVKITVDSILKFASFVRKIFIVTDNQIPFFLKKKEETSFYDKVFIIDHKIIFNGKESCLPTFNNRSIETNFHKIPNLSEHFIYLNDDFFLIKKTSLNDFFINGEPVLRGRWKAFYDEEIIKRLIGKKQNKLKANHRKGQETGAKMLGLKKFYKFEHTPHPIRKSTIVNFFEKNPDLEAMNSSYKFRHYNQFLIQGLANHLEIINKTCVFKRSYGVVFIQNYTRSFLWLKIKLRMADYNKNKLFLNLQNLNICPEDKLNYILNWLKEKYS